ncbi:hypothetical protein F2Q70_00040246 [Brassica cretica]|uniref:Uncharacterized protein n=1 Tax=Brassica cretica TaxID=69181 RepID=A0A8S9K251_BRACR|nr:hypothetical protein F2Q70_00040246 [Brassica cretica]
MSSILASRDFDLGSHDKSLTPGCFEAHIPLSSLAYDSRGQRLSKLGVAGSIVHEVWLMCSGLPSGCELFRMRSQHLLIDALRSMKLSVERRLTAEDACDVAEDFRCGSGEVPLWFPALGKVIGFGDTCSSRC